MSVKQPSNRQKGLCLFGRSAEPAIPIATLTNAIGNQKQVEEFRPLLPIGYTQVAKAYCKAASEVTVDELTTHYTKGLDFFHKKFIPHIKNILTELSGNTWDLEDYLGFAAGSDVDMMSHIVEASASRGTVCLFPGDWYGFLVGSSWQNNIKWDQDSTDSLACLCIPSVRNGHVTEEMVDFLEKAKLCLLNLNLYPTLLAEERKQVAMALEHVFDKSILSISFSRGFGLTASQLGVILIHKNHPWAKKFSTQWNWFTYFYNALAAKVFIRVSIKDLQEVDQKRRLWVENWLQKHNLPIIKSGSYYVKSFLPQGNIPDLLKPLVRDNIVRLCFKPNLT